MITPTQIIETAAARGVRLFRDGETLVIRAKKGALSPVAKERLLAGKSALLPFLPVVDSKPSAAREVIDPNPMSAEQIAAFTAEFGDWQPIADESASEGLYRNVIAAEWDGETHTVDCEGWPVMLATKGAEPDRESIAFLNQCAERRDPAYQSACGLLEPFAELLALAESNALPAANWFLPAFTSPEPGRGYGAPCDDPNAAALAFARQVRDALRRGDEERAGSALECLDSVAWAVKRGETRK